MLEINWDLIPSNFRFAAIDMTGELWIYSEKPEWVDELKIWTGRISTDSKWLGDFGPRDNYMMQERC